LFDPVEVASAKLLFFPRAWGTMKSSSGWGGSRDGRVAGVCGIAQEQLGRNQLLDIAWEARVLIARGEVAAAPSFYGDSFPSTEDEVDQALQRLLVPAQP
jgi:hypothetical protein